VVPREIFTKGTGETFSLGGGGGKTTRLLVEGTVRGQDGRKNLRVDGFVGGRGLFEDLLVLFALGVWGKGTLPGRKSGVLIELGTRSRVRKGQAVLHRNILEGAETGSGGGSKRR